MMIKLDGKYIPKSGWMGPIGKLLEKVNELKRRSTFPALADTRDIREIPQEILQKLSLPQTRRTVISLYLQLRKDICMLNLQRYCAVN